MVYQCGHWRSAFGGIQFPIRRRLGFLSDMPNWRNLYYNEMRNLFSSMLPVERLPFDPKGTIGSVEVGESAAPAESQSEMPNTHFKAALSNRWWLVEGMLRKELRKTLVPMPFLDLVKVW